jgi:hypothetical protein
MTTHLTEAGYEQTKQKLSGLEERLAEIERRTDIHADRLAAVRRSYLQMMRQYRREIKLYEKAQEIAARSKPADVSSD